jgi:hypothetical protein
MRNKLVSAVLFVIFLTSVNVIAQEGKKPLTNSDVIQMMKAGLSENTVILAIQKGPTEFDTSPQSLIQLKNQGVSPAVLDAMIQAGTAPSVPNQTTVSSRQNNAVNPPGSTNVTVPAAGGVFLIDGAQRTSMKYSTPETRSNSMLGAVVNPFHKSRIRAALTGNHAQLRTKNTSPVFEVTLAADANPSDLVTLVKLKPKSETREIETLRTGITGVSSGYRKEDRLAVTLEETTAPTSANQKIYRVKLVNPLVPGEYALVYGAGLYYDFGVDAN